MDRDLLFINAGDVMLNNSAIKSSDREFLVDNKQGLTKTYRYRNPLWRTAFFYLHRVVLNPFIRRCVVRTLGLWIGKGIYANSPRHSLLQPLQHQGFVRLDDALSDAQCSDILEYLSNKPVYDKHALIEHAFSPTQPDDMAFGIYSAENVMDCPHIVELVTSREIIKLAADYLGCIPTLATLGVQWSFLTKSPRAAQKFHRDAEDWKYLRFIIYLSDVDEGCGPHVYVAGSHRDKLPLRMKFYLPEEISHQYGSDRTVRVHGKRGTGVAADTCGIHKGEQPTTGPRLVLNFTYSILPNQLSEYKPIKTRHASHRINYVTRLFLKK